MLKGRFFSSAGYYSGPLLQSKAFMLYWGAVLFGRLVYSAFFRLLIYMKSPIKGLILITVE